MLFLISSIRPSARYWLCSSTNERKTFYERREGGVKTHLLLTSHSIWLLIRSAVATRAKQTSSAEQTDQLFSQVQWVLRPSFSHLTCGYDDHLCHNTDQRLLRFLPSHTLVLIVALKLNKCVPTNSAVHFILPAINSAEWTRFNYHYSSNY